MNNICQCGCGVKLRKDNRTGYQKGHKPCPICGTLVKGSGLECCSKACSAKLHWQRHPEMKETRSWNTARNAVRELNREGWLKNLSDACIGRSPWNKGKKGVQVPWNKELPAEQQPFFGKKHNKEYYQKRDKTVFDRYGVKYATELAKSSPRSKKEKLLEQYLVDYKINQRIGSHKPDYVNEDKKHIIEVYGDYWHCNPKTFKEDFYHSQLKMTAKEKWQKDLVRKIELESLGYEVTIVWESELKNFIEELKE
jgi:G:T-mismatch repair DNA endonuclease (very short patch repair protein)